MEKESMFWPFQINQKNEKKTFITIKTTLVLEGIIKHMRWLKVSLSANISDIWKIIA
jgi:hypothetical protein